MEKTYWVQCGRLGLLTYTTGGTGQEKYLTNQDRTSDLEMIIQLQSHALPTELW